MPGVPPCAPQGADRPPSSRHIAVALGTAGTSLATRESYPACLPVGTSRTGGHFYCNSDYSDTLPPLVLLARTHCNSCVLDIAGPRADSAPDIWVVPEGVPGRFFAEVGVAQLSVP